MANWTITHWSKLYKDNLIRFDSIHLVSHYTPHLLSYRVVYSQEYGSALISGLMVPGCEINLVIHHCHSLFSNPCMHSPVCICQSGRVASLPSAVAQNSVALCWSERATSDHQEGDWVVVTFIGIPEWALCQSDVGASSQTLEKKYTTLSLSAKGAQNLEL